MDMIEIVYLSSFFLGLGFTLISALLSGVFSSGGEGIGNVDAHGAHAGDGGSLHLLPFFNPMTIAIFIATFGGTGIIFKKYLAWPALVHVPVAGACALVLAVATFYLFFRVLGGTETSSVSKAEDAIGLDAEVLTTIPGDAVGEVAYTLHDSRIQMPARSADGKTIPAHSLVKIVRFVGGTVYVDRVKTGGQP